MLLDCWSLRSIALKAMNMLIFSGGSWCCITEKILFFESTWLNIDLIVGLCGVWFKLVIILVEIYFILFNIIVFHFQSLMRDRVCIVYVVILVSLAEVGVIWLVGSLLASHWVQFGSSSATAYVRNHTNVNIQYRVVYDGSKVYIIVFISLVNMYVWVILYSYFVHLVHFFYRLFFRFLLVVFLRLIFLGELQDRGPEVD